MSRGGVLGLLFFSFFHLVDYGVVGVLGYIFHSVSFLTKNITIQTGTSVK